jgi:cyclopropane fatty-acyl-phospholipid synthase-like methyltransferase
MKPFSESCEQNKQPILEILRKEFANAQRVLEIGSGTGQHAVYFAAEFPHLTWQTSDVAEYHPGILAWQADAKLKNIQSPLILNVAENSWPDTQYDAVFSANTVHIMGWPEVEAMFAGIGSILELKGRFCLYGPFNYGGKFTSESNARFDQWLKARDPRSGVRNFEDLDCLANAAGMRLAQDYAMPANNRILVWLKTV